MVPTNLPYLHLPTYLPIFLPYQPYPPYLPYHLTYPPPTYRAAPRRRRAPLAAGHARGHRVVPWLSPPGSWPGTCEAMAWLRANLLRPRAWGANQGTVERHATACSWCFHLPAAVELRRRRRHPPPPQTVAPAAARRHPGEGQICHLPSARSAGLTAGPSGSLVPAHVVLVAVGRRRGGSRGKVAHEGGSISHQRIMRALTLL